VTITLADTPTTREFAGLSGQNALVDTLRTNLAYTLVSSPQSPRALKLDPTCCRTQDGARYIATALTSVCRLAAPGLAQLMLHVAGGRPVTVRAEDAYSHRTACAVFNEVIDLRFSQLAHCQMVVNRGTSRIEGVLGPRTVHLDHLTLFDLADSVFREVSGEFACARLSGRRLYLRYDTPTYVAIRDVNYRFGLVMVANEAGDDAVACYHYYGHPSGFGMLRQPPAIRRQRRVGNALRERLRATFMGVAQPPRELAGSRRSDSRVFSNTTPEHIQLVPRVWTRRMRLVGVPLGIAKDVMAQLVVAPGGVGRAPDNRILALTEHDIGVALMQAAAQRSARLQELLQRAAAKLLYEETA